MSPAATESWESWESWEIDRWLHALRPTHFHPVLSLAITNLDGVQRATPIDPYGISLAGQSEL
ncbi:hypothetical protein HO173_011910 [Letharia columbiana]|uniref:Uncharacterized protein n=1 Tax=Letharia columbiana TaxID=112416 RepID=A0A8H6FH93_9LECA|nr:uncharacterized protein HO173_011910 [Letharia columbiana]KAF6227808.1 hypothetical protein HO173_011910 [Letharia columbiana]